MKKKRTDIGKRLLAMVLVAAMAFTLQWIRVSAETATGESGQIQLAATGSENPANPVHHCTKRNDGSDYTDWSYVYFGSYPQSEVTGDELTSAITGVAYDANGDAWVKGVKYRRVLWSGEYRYFKWERIRWRVLRNDGSTLFLMADKLLEHKSYNDTTGSVTWETCTLRRWLNDTFYKTAFDSSEKNAIVEQNVVNENNPKYGTEGGNNTKDKVYLLSIGEAQDPDYGFCKSDTAASVSREVQRSEYFNHGSSPTCDYYYWLLRSPGNGIDTLTSKWKAADSSSGSINCYGETSGGIVPVLHVNLASSLLLGNKAPTVSAPSAQSVKAGSCATFSVSASGGNPDRYTYQWYCARMRTGIKIKGATSASYTIPADQVANPLDGRYYYCAVSNGVYEVESERAKLTVSPETPSPSNPVHHCGKWDEGGVYSDYTDWSYVYFGSYPQTEVTGSALTASITGAAYDANGDAWVNGVKYRRVSKSDVDNEGYFGDSAYWYFKWERIKWRILKNDGSTLFVMADKGLDCKKFIETGGDSKMTWEACDLRSWLNDSFYKTAFSGSEQDAIIEQNVVNLDTSDGPGGNDTRDKVYLLSGGEVCDSGYGFCGYYSNGNHVFTKQVQASDYVHVKGAPIDISINAGGNCGWHLRTRGFSRFRYVDEIGHIEDWWNYSLNCAVVPVLHIDLSSPLWHLTDDGGSGAGGSIGNTAPTVSAPSAQSVKAGNSATFSVNASGGGPDTYTYQWYYATAQEGAGTKIEGATSASYTIPASQVTSDLNGRYYYCAVSNEAYEVASERAKLTVYSSPEVSGPQSQSVPAGEGIGFYVTASGGNPTSYTYQWYYATSQFGAGIKIEGATEPVYMITSGQMTSSLNGRYYYCVVSNGECETESARAKLTVLTEEEPDSTPPTVSAPAAQSVKAGSSATFSVSASGGNPDTYTYQWYYAASQTGAGTKIEGATSSAYTISSGQMTAGLNGRYYYCIVSNGECETESARAKLTVLTEEEPDSTPPTVSAPAEQSVKVGSSATFSVSASGGNPDTYTYQWYYATSQSGAGTKIEGATSASYTIPASQMTSSLNGRYYYCVVSNGAYEVESARAKLTVAQDSNPENNKTPSLKTQKIIASSFTKEYGSKPFSLKAKTTGNGKLTYKTNNKKVAAVSSKGTVTVKNYGTATITIKAAKTSKYKAASAKVTVKVVPKKATLTKASAIGDRKVSLKWKKTSAIDGYEMYLSLKSNFKSETFKRIYGKNQTSVTLTGLQKGKTYYIKICCYKKVGKKPYYGAWSKVRKVKIR